MVWIDGGSSSGGGGDIIVHDGYFADGTAANPSITFTNDSNTGLYRVGTDTLGITTAGINAASVNASGNWVLTPAGGATNVIDIQPIASGATGIKMRSDNLVAYADWGQAGTGLYSFNNSSTNGAIWSATLEMRSPVAGASATSSSGKMLLKYDSTKRVPPGISFDGYSFQDIYTGIIKYKTGNQTTASATLTDDTDFTVTLDANSRYIFELYYQTSNDTASEGAKIDFAGTAAVLTFVATVEVGQVTVSATGGLTALGSGGVGATIVGTATGFVMAKGAIENAATGTFKVQLAQNAHVSGTTTFKKGSWFKLLKI